MAAAFGVGIGYHPEAYALLEARYPPGEFNECASAWPAFRMAPALVAQPVSAAPGFHIGNVFVMAGVPMVMRAMLEEIAPELPRGRTVIQRHGGGQCSRRHDRARPGAIAERSQDVAIGSYPFYREGARQAFRRATGGAGPRRRSGGTRRAGT